MKKYSYIVLVLFILLSTGCGKGNSVELEIGGVKQTFSGDFYIYFSETDPKMALRPSKIEGVQYNVITWEGNFSSNETQQVERKNEQTGDGFDDSILEGDIKQRTADIFALQEKVLVEPISINKTKGKIEFQYEENEKFIFTATINFDSEYGYPQLEYTIIPKMKGYYSVIYSGAPQFDVEKVEEIWQPMIWQEKRFPDMSYITAAFQCPVPTTFVHNKDYTLGVIAKPDEFPFNPLPTLGNSRFAVALRTESGNVSPMLIAPILGGEGSLRDKGEKFHFSSLLYISKNTITSAYEDVARNIYGFSDYRHNDIATLNQTLENVVDYSLSEYSWFIDEQKGCGYSTDVPGAVKNVSSLNPLELAMVMDDKTMFEERAYPIIEYQLSREKFLFSSDSTQKIQSPSRKMDGPIAPISELTSLYMVTNQNMPFLIELSKSEYEKKRIRNLDVEERGDTWQNALWLYKATKKAEWLEKAKQGADNYLKTRVDEKAKDFSDPDSGGFFFWTGYTPRWIDMLELYEITNDKKYLDAAHDGARHYTMFTWMSPAIPNDSILVNKGGKAPLYWYLERKGHKQMYAPEENAPAWRLAEIGLTPESSGTCSGHRAIFMTNYSPWMLRIAYYTNDQFLRDVAKAAIIGRYRSFPGYHMNTARTTVYEKEDYPLRGHKDLSVNSFHYNHIMPKASFLLDYLITDVWYRSKTAINFPDEFIEGYAYLQSKYYGFAEGQFYENKAKLWMPKSLLKTQSIELNYVSARNENDLMIAFTNQSKENVDSEITLNLSKLRIEKSKVYRVKVIADNQNADDIEMTDGKFNVKVSANGITAVIIEGVRPKVEFQDLLQAKTKGWKTDYFESTDGTVRAMYLNLGEVAQNAYIYLTKDDNVFLSVTLEASGLRQTDKTYPFEFTVPVVKGANSFEAEISATKINGEKVSLGKILLKE